MARLIVTIEGAATGPFAAGLSVPVNLTDDDSDRALAWVATKYGRNPDGSPRSVQEAAAAYVDALARDLFAQVTWAEQEAAAEAARVAVPAIPYTLG